MDSPVRIPGQSIDQSPMDYARMLVRHGMEEAGKFCNEDARFLMDVRAIERSRHVEYTAMCEQLDASINARVKLGEVILAAASQV